MFFYLKNSIYRSLRKKYLKIKKDAYNVRPDQEKKILEFILK